MSSKNYNKKCEHPDGCNKWARGFPRLCAKHGGGRRCLECNSLPYKTSKYCVKHGGSLSCLIQDCDNNALTNYKYCQTHDQYNRCSVANCKNKYLPGYTTCVKHGAGKRCHEKDCPNAAVGTTNHCKRHKGGVRCKIKGCPNAARFGKNILVKGACVKHGGKERCKFKKCKKNKCDGSDFCTSHGGGLRCFIPACDKRKYNTSIACLEHSDEYYVKYDMIVSAKSNDNVKLKKGKLKKDQICNLEISDIDQLLEKQNKKCYYCSKELIIKRGGERLNGSHYGSHKNISLDRLKSNTGHIKNNVILSCLFCNIGRNCAEEEQWKEMIKVLNSTKLYQPDYLEEEYYGKWASNLKDRIIMRHTKISDEKTDITLEWIKSQPLVCYYTGIKLYPSKKSWYVFQPSLDRIDNTKGYTKDNVIMVCRGLNSARNQMEFFEFLNYLKTFKN